MDRRTRQIQRALATGEISSFEGFARAANVLRRGGLVVDARTCARKAISLLRAELPLRRRAEFEAKGCPVCKGKGEIVFRGRLRPCPNKVGKLCTPKTRAASGTLDLAEVKPEERKLLQEMESLAR